MRVDPAVDVQQALLARRAPEIRAQLGRILRSPHFAATPRRKKLLQYLVDQTLEGRSERLKGFTIALEVFGRDESFDPQTDPIVRLEAMRLRRDLEHYYLTAGPGDPLRISIPKGAYAPDFAWDAPSEPENATDGADVPSARASRGSTAKSWRRRLTLGLVLAGMAALVLLAFGAGAWREPKPDRGPATHAAGSQLPAVFVTTFEDAGEPGGDFAIGLTEQIVSDLARFQGIRVVWTRSAWREQAAPGPAPREPASFVLDGSVRSHGESIRITARLLDATAGTIIWSERFDSGRGAGDTLSFQDEISQRVAVAIASDQGVVAQTVLAATYRKKAPRSLAPYECVARARSFHGIGAAAGYGQIRDCLENSVKVEPSYAEAWTMLSLLYGMDHRLGSGFSPAPAGSRRKALDAAETAIALNQRSAAAHLALAIAYFDMKDLTRFQEAAETAIDLNPIDPVVLGNAGLRLATIGLWERGLALVTKAAVLSPEQLNQARFARFHYRYHRGEYELALAEATRIDPGALFWPDAMQAMAYGQLGRSTEMHAAVARLLAIKPHFAAQFWGSVDAWNFPRQHAMHMAEGLRKAGLPVEHEAE